MTPAKPITPDGRLVETSPDSHDTPVVKNWRVAEELGVIKPRPVGEIAAKQERTLANQQGQNHLGPPGNEFGGPPLTDAEYEAAFQYADPANPTKEERERGSDAMLHRYYNPPMTRAKVEAVAEWLEGQPSINYSKWQKRTAVALRAFAAEEFPDESEPSDG